MRAKVAVAEGAERGDVANDSISARPTSENILKSGRATQHRRVTAAALTAVASRVLRDVGGAT